MLNKFICFKKERYTPNSQLAKIHLTFDNESNSSEDISLAPSTPINISPKEDILYVILPYFNFCKSTRRKQLFIEFINRIKNINNIRIVVVEGTIENFTLPKVINGVFSHHGFKYKTQFWCKENLINLAVHTLPTTWKYMAWIDADITFLNNNWVNLTIEELKKYNFVQLFETAVNMGPNEEAIKIDRSFGYMYKNSNNEWVADHRYGYWHCGYAWSCNRYAFDKLNGIIDIDILGSGDLHLALALIQKIDKSVKPKEIPKYLDILKDYETLIRIYNITLSYIPGTILHHWHGRFQDRKYVERWSILIDNKYEPNIDIIRNSDGQIELSEKGKRMEKEIQQYFIDRQEDNMSI
jgi:hypothetical protein